MILHFKNMVQLLSYHWQAGILSKPEKKRRGRKTFTTSLKRVQHYHSKRKTEVKILDLHHLFVLFKRANTESLSLFILSKPTLNIHSSGVLDVLTEIPSYFYRNTKRCLPIPQADLEAPVEWASKHFQYTRQLPVVGDNIFWRGAVKSRPLKWLLILLSRFKERHAF